jgi:cellulose synthase/poly-beta-1,6-N-acetylglucosamine synthase-like glycosyltransferase
MIVTVIGTLLLVLPGLLFGYAYFVYPALLRLMGGVGKPVLITTDPPEWPAISIVLPAYNEEESIGPTLDSLLALDYPADRRQILVLSDASTDRTDEIVRGFASRGVELFQATVRCGKTAAENAALSLLTSEIIVNIDATTRILPASLKPLIRVFQDPTIGVASGRDVSVGDVAVEASGAESDYVVYEMWVRALETRIGSIVGSSGCFYAIRRSLHEILVPAEVARDFASALTAREHGFRSVSVDAAVCFVPRTASLRGEFRRKTRTMASGLATLWYKRRLLNPFQYGLFAWMLWSHKLVRWLVFLAAPPALTELALLSLDLVVAQLVLALVLVVIVLGVVALRSPEGTRLPQPVALCGFALAAHVAGLVAWSKVIRGELSAVWEPTRRPMPDISQQ